MLLLHTRGARSGEPRTTPLLYTPLDDAFIVVASKAGADHHPAWYHNIRAHPDAVSVEFDGRRVAVRPRIVEGAERSELWERVNDNYNGYETYARRAGGRVIPLVVLDPVSTNTRDRDQRGDIRPPVLLLCCRRPRSTDTVGVTTERGAREPVAQPTRPRRRL